MSLDVGGGGIVKPYSQPASNLFTLWLDNNVHGWNFWLLSPFTQFTYQKYSNCTSITGYS